MIKGLGTDIIEIKRFSQWYMYSSQKLRRIFSADEIKYCFDVTTNSAQRFAVRFAAKEAMVKALSAMGLTLPLMYVFRHASIVKNEKGKPSFLISETLRKMLPERITIHISLSHAKEYAVAFVVIDQAE